MESIMKADILVVDDNDALAEGIRDILEAQEYRVVIANDGFMAISLTEKDSYDIVLMDVKMPKLNGVEAFKKIKEVRPGIKVIMMTGYSDEGLIKEAIEEGVSEVMRKPVDIDRLLCLIEAIVR